MTQLKSLLQSLIRIHEIPGGYLVGTTELLSSGEVVSLAVLGGDRECTVSDRGLAIRELSVAGAAIADPTRLLRPYAGRYQVVVSGTDLLLHTPTESVQAAIMLVANACREAYDTEIRRIKISPRRDIREALDRYLSTSVLADHKKNAVLSGQNARHTFAHIFKKTGTNNLIIVDPVIPEYSSINARVVAHLDIRKELQGTAEQFMVYDDEDDWPTDKLGILQLAAPVVPFSAIGKEVMPRLIASTQLPTM